MALAFRGAATRPRNAGVGPAGDDDGAAEGAAGSGADVEARVPVGAVEQPALGGDARHAELRLTALAGLVHGERGGASLPLFSTKGIGFILVWRVAGFTLGRRSLYHSLRQGTVP
jgi:hypothetical protein